MKTDELVKELPKGLIKWYKFHKSGKALYITGGIESCEALPEALMEMDLAVDTINVSDLENNDFAKSEAAYDYVVTVGALERSKRPDILLQNIRNMLSRNGRFLLGTDNRLGIRYFCGDRDAFTGRNFDSIENYVRINASDREELEGRAYAKAEIAQMLKKAGFSTYRFFSVLPVLERPQVLYAEDYLPNEELDVRIFPQYNCPNTIFLEEEKLYTTLIQNGLFHIMANGYFVECSMDNIHSNVKQVTISMERGRKNAMATIIRCDNKVEKRPVYKEGYEKLECLSANNIYLEQHGINMIDAVIEDNALVMPYVQGEPAVNYFRELIYKDKKTFLQKFDYFWQLIQKSSEHVPYEEVNWEQFAPNWQKRKSDDPNKDKWKRVAFGSDKEKDDLGIILKRGYADLVPLNCFFADGEFIFYDQELFIENLPAKVILQRAINLIYMGNTQLELALPKKQLEERYSLTAYIKLWNQFTSFFLNELRNDKKLSEYHKMYRCDSGVIHSNRQKINYSTDEYERIFRDIFDGTQGRKIFLFGSGNFAKKFLSQFGTEYDIAGILDNNSDKWESEFEGVKIFSPDYLMNIPIGSYKVIVCIKNYVPVIKQLKEMGVKNYAIYDSNMIYKRSMPLNINRNLDITCKHKPYKVGYIAGVFDLFHIGHLNMFKRAKEQCDYLIVGVVSDESVMVNKKTMPYIPFEERIELVRACRYVDEAVEIPKDYGDTAEAYRRYQFDVQFSGSDYANDPVWLAKKVFLEQHGAEMVFFPYTEQTSSTKIKALIEKGLI